MFDPRSRRILLLLLVVVAVVAAAALLTGRATPPAAGSGGDNAAVAINTKDGSTVFRVRLQITRANGDVIDASNAAVAYASCSDCETVAIAFQAVLATGDASVIDPTNIAIAVNEGCTNCTTLADAYQQLLMTDGQVHFTAAGNEELAQIRRDLESLRSADLSTDELISRLDQLSADFASVLAHDVVVAGKPL